MDDEVVKIIDQIKEETDYFNKAKLIEHLRKDKNFTIKDLSLHLGLKPSYTCHILRLNRLPDIVVDGYYAQLVTLSHLFIISRLKKTDQIIKAYEKILTDNLTVLQLEYLVRKILYDVTTEGEHLSADELQDFITVLSEKNKDMSISLIQTRIKAKLTIELKGNLKKTSESLKNLFNLLKGKSK